MWRQNLILSFLLLGLVKLSYGVAVQVDAAAEIYDVCVIGGGSSGTYAAVRLQQMGKKVALIERQAQLGGHVNTYSDPTTNQTLDYGVYILSNLPVVQDFFAHFDMPLAAFSETNSSLRAYADFRTGVEVPEVGSEYTPADVSAALQRYAAQLSTYQSFTGTPGWQLPNPVPEDLLLPFGDFVDKYELQAMVDTVFVFLQGVGNILAQPTLYIMRYFDISITRDFTTGNLVQNAYRDNQDLFDKALAELNSGGSRAFLDSHISEVRRSNSGVVVNFDTSDGAQTINAAKLLISIPPKLDNLGFLDLVVEDKELFAQFNNSYYYAAVVRDSGIPNDILRLTNVDPDAPLNLPAQPSLLVVTATGVENLRGVYYGSTSPMSADAVQAEILAGIEGLQGRLDTAPGNSSPKIVAFDDHSPFLLTVSTDEIRNGFYEKLQALQGKDSTWWTGATWYKPATADLWNFTEHEFLPKLLA